MDVLRAGGDAVDAAVTAALVLGVVSPTASGLGGGGFAMVYRAKEQKVYVIDFRETAPKDIDVATMDGRPVPAEKRGPLVGTPGEVAGLDELLHRWGSRTFAQAAAPAIKFANDGFVISPFTRKAAKFIQGPFKTASVALGLPILGEAEIPEGSMAKRPALGATLQTLSTQGAKAFYTGHIAAELANAVKDHGGWLTVADLEGYKVKTREPLQLTLGKRTLYAMPPPSAGGIMLLQTFIADDLLRKKEGKGLDRDPLGSAKYFHRVAELMRGSLDDRARYLTDPDVGGAVDVKKLLDPARVEKRLALIKDDVTHKPVELQVDEHGTTHITIVDQDGDAIALTTTHNGPFGARFVGGDTGLLLNDEMDDFSKSKLADGTPSPNVPRPFARPVSSMVPVLAVEDGHLTFIAGGSGGQRIATSVTLVALARLVFGANIKDAVDAARIHTNDAKLMVDEWMPADVIAALKAAGETVESGVNINGVQAATIDWDAAGPHVSAAADPRKLGLSLAE